MALLESANAISLTRFQRYLSPVPVVRAESLSFQAHVAVASPHLSKHTTCHTFQHSLATHLLESGCDIRMVQELLGHNDVKTTMIYTYVLNRGPSEVCSPVDEL